MSRCLLCRNPLHMVHVAVGEPGGVFVCVSCFERQVRQHSGRLADTAA
jgi:hypothetical protein